MARTSQSAGGRLSILMSVLTLLMSVGTASGQERYRLTPDERLAVNDSARMIWDGTRIERVTAQSIDDQIVARVEFIAHAGNDQAAEFYVSNCTRIAAEEGAGGQWQCEELQQWRHISVGNNGDTIQVSPGLDIPGAFEIARFVRQLHLLEKDAMTNETLVGGVINPEQLQDQIMIEQVDDAFRVSLKGQPLKYNYVMLGRKPCGRFATCGLEFLSAGASVYTALPPTKRAAVRPSY